MAYNNPISEEEQRPNVGLDMVLNSLVRDFNKIDWLEERVFLRAYEFKQEGVDRKITTEPQVYVGNGEYYRVLYNDNLPCSIFFKSDGEEIIVFDKLSRSRMIKYTRNLSLIFWGVLTRINTEYSGDYIFTEGIKAEFMTILAKNQHTKSINRYYDDPLEKIFEGYSISEEKTHLAKFPYTALRIDFTIEYQTGVVPC